MRQGFAEAGLPRPRGTVQEDCAVEGDQAGVDALLREEQGGVCVLQQPLLDVALKYQAVPQGMELSGWQLPLPAPFPPFPGRNFV